VSSEQDTFNALRREPFREVLVKCFERASLGAELLDWCDDIIRAAGWSYTELNEELKCEILKGNINLNLMTIRDSNAQKNFLLTGKI